MTPALLVPLRRLRTALAAMLLPAFLSVTPAAKAQNDVVHGDSLLLVEHTMRKLGKNLNFAVLPGPSYNTTQKLGFAIVPVLVYNLDTADHLSPPSSTGLLLYGSFSGSWAVAAQQNLFWYQNRWRASATFGYGDLRMKFFGVGCDTAIVDNDPSRYHWMRIEGLNGSVNCFRRIFARFYGGLQYNFATATLTGTDSAATAALKAESLPEGTETESSLVPSFIWDNRNNIYWTVHGFYAGAGFQFANSFFMSSRNYSIITGFASGYHRLIRHSDRLTMAWHFYMQAGWGDIPYARMANYGRGDRVTGYTGGKYVNRSEVSAEGELRYDFWKFLGAGVYLGAGKVFPSFETFGQSVWLPFTGVRTYINVLPTRNLRVRLDCAFGRQDFGFYVGMGQAF